MPSETSAELLLHRSGLATALTFDDVLLVPQHSDVDADAVDVTDPF